MATIMEAQADLLTEEDRQVGLSMEEEGHLMGDQVDLLMGEDPITEADHREDRLMEEDLQARRL